MWGCLVFSRENVAEGGWLVGEQALRGWCAKKLHETGGAEGETCCKAGRTGEVSVLCVEEQLRRRGQPCRVVVPLQRKEAGSGQRQRALWKEGEQEPSLEPWVVASERLKIRALWIREIQFASQLHDTKNRVPEEHPEEMEPSPALGESSRVSLRRQGWSRALRRAASLCCRAPCCSKAQQHQEKSRQCPGPFLWPSLLASSAAVTTQWPHEL